MQTLTDALVKATAKSVPIIYSEVTRIDKADAGWRVQVGQESMSCSRVVLACPAHVSAALLDRSAPEMATELLGIPYSSAILAMLLFDRATLGHSLDGFGFLIPRNERETIAAATWVNTKFPSRIRPGLAAMRGFIADLFLSVQELVCIGRRRRHRVSRLPAASSVDRTRRLEVFLYS